jgi:putative ABC transport system ATP-binding protein
MTMAMLELRNVYKTFNAGTPDEVRALRGLDLKIEPESFVVVIGTNGSGKSTTLNAVAGSFPVDAGKIELAGRNITSWPEHRRAKLIGRVFQDPLAGTSPALSIAENLALASRRGLHRGFGRAVSRRALTDFRDRVRPLGMGLEDRLDNPIGSLSGGQRQALTLLMATYRRPELLLLDEHTAALDPRSAEQVIRLTDQVVRRQHLTTMMVTHSMAHAASLGDRLVMVHQGRLIFDVSGAAKHRLRPNDLLEKFEELRRSDQLDETAAQMLREVYV